MKRKVIVPATREQGSYTCIASESYNLTIAKDALWMYNSARAHDGLPPIKRMPRGTKYLKLK